mgnify:FL=1
MPLYEYQCDACSHRFERIQKFSDPPVDVCPECGKGPVTKLISAPGIQFKGAGWYITDYAGGSSSAATSDSLKQKPESKSETKSETKADAKPSTSPETK